MKLKKAAWIYKAIGTFFLLIVSFLNQSRADIKVGVILPLSGELAAYGVAFKNGMQMAQMDNPALFDKTKFQFEDSAYDNQRALLSFHNLRENLNSQIIFVWGSGPTDAIAPVAERLGFPLLTYGEYTSAKNRKNIINFANPSFQFSQILAEYIKQRKFKKIGIVLTSIAYLESLAKALGNNLSSDIKLDLVENFQPGDMDFKSTISKIAHANYDAIGVFLLNGQISQFYRQMGQHNLNLPTFGSDFFESTEEIQAAGPKINGAVYVNNISDPGFTEKYLARYGNDIHLTDAARGYDFAGILAREMDLLPESLSGQEVFRAIKRISTRVGMSGQYEFKNAPETGSYISFPLKLKTVVR